MEFLFTPIYFDSKEIDEKTVIRIFGRDKNGKKICVLDYFEPHFYVITENPEKISKEIEKKFPEAKIKIENKNFLGHPVKSVKIQSSNREKNKEIIDHLSKYHDVKIKEHDINVITQYIISKKMRPCFTYKIKGEILDKSQEFRGMDSSIDVSQVIKLESLEKIEGEKLFTPKAIAYDIETDNFEIGKGKITMISLVGDGIKKVLTWQKISSPPSYVETLSSEEEMIEPFITEIKKLSPDILVGYYSDSFDLPYLRERARNLKIKFDIGLDNSEPKFSKGNNISGNIAGIVHIDLFKFIKVAYSQYLQAETLSLDSVANELIGEGKLELKHIGDNPDKFSEKQWQEFFEYNLNDSAITKKLFDKAWQDILEFSRVIGEPLFEVTRNGMSQNVEHYILHNLERFNEIAEERPTHDEIESNMRREKYEGAFVLQPKPGLYENLGMFDFTSYWPSMIVTFNLSKSTLLRKKEENATEIEIDRMVYFSKEPGFFPQLLHEIINLRKKYKKELAEKFDPIKKARSNAFKLLANASYGYQGFYGARYYCPEASAAATAISRKFIKETIDKINQEKFPVVYSDTDSIVFTLNKHSKDDAKKVLKKLNDDLPGIVELDLEGFFKRGIWVTTRSGEFGAKKKYALLGEDNKFKIRGFETVRRDWCKLARKLQNKIIELILQDGNEKKALEYTKKIIAELKTKKIPIEDLIIKSQLKKSLHDYKSISPHVKIAQKMKELNIPLSEGALIEFFIAQPPKDSKKSLIRDRAKLPFEFNTKSPNYDIEYYLNNQLLPAVENIFQVFDVNTKELIDGHTQKTLF